MTNYDRLIDGYEVDVEFPDVSGAEHLQMLLIRSQLETGHDRLTKMQNQRLEQADRRLLQQAPLFYEALQQFVDFAKHRQQQNIPTSHWWWYLDVIAQLSTQYELSFRPVATNGALSSAHNLPVGA